MTPFTTRSDLRDCYCAMYPGALIMYDCRCTAVILKRVWLFRCSDVTFNPWCCVAFNYTKRRRKRDRHWIQKFNNVQVKRLELPDFLIVYYYVVEFHLTLTDHSPRNVKLNSTSNNENASSKCNCFIFIKSCVFTKYFVEKWLKAYE